jgi:tRNA splicing ligase
MTKIERQISNKRNIFATLLFVLITNTGLILMPYQKLSELERYKHCERKLGRVHKHLRCHK